MKNLLILIAILFSFTAFSQKGKDKIDPVIHSSYPEDGAFYYKSSGHICVSADVSDNDRIWGTTFTIDPNRDISWKPQQNIGAYYMGAFIQSVPNPSKCFDLDSLNPGEHTLQIDVWDYAKNQTTKTITFIVIE